MAECNHNCSQCGQECSSRAEIKVTQDTHIKHIISILSGKGGVGKSLITALLAIELTNHGYKVGIMDGDITGPSIPKMFGLKGELFGDELGIFPALTQKGIEVVSINNMVQDETTPVMWRGPILGNVIKQFYTEVHWGELDYLLIDMPPGTSDVAIGVIQQIPLESFVMVTTPSKLVSMVVAKAINMAKQVNKPILGLVENMAYVKCDNCGKRIDIYKEDVTQDISKQYSLDLLAQLPIDPYLANLSDNGQIEQYADNYLAGLLAKL